MASVFLLHVRFLKFDWTVLVADVTFYVSVNTVGVFTKCLNDEKTSGESSTRAESGVS